MVFISDMTNNQEFYLQGFFRWLVISAQKSHFEMLREAGYQVFDSCSHITRLKNSALNYIFVRWKEEMERHNTTTTNLQ